MADFTLFPSIIPDSDEPFADTKYQKRELERLERNELQQLAAQYEGDEINGMSSNEEIIEALTGVERIND